ncbi:unnamed protein product [Prorocentrum cordatum]|uniref:Uncharacterized protein n=1 Tax=Prorocentrum cordatum TaxID=2364126 RepID=A0ABN9PZW4_9DINO|nr:unnamed protein product [Polarella glacialis]
MALLRRGPGSRVPAAEAEGPDAELFVPMRGGVPVDEEVCGKGADFADSGGPPEAPGVWGDVYGGDVGGGWLAARSPVRPRSCCGDRGGKPLGTAFRFEVLGGDEALAVDVQDMPPMRCLLAGMELGAGAGRRSGRGGVGVPARAVPRAGMPPRSLPPARPSRGWRLRRSGLRVRLQTGHV